MHSILFLTLLVKIGFHICNSHELIHGDGLGAHGTCFSRLHNPVTSHKKIEGNNVIKININNMYITGILLPAFNYVYLKTNC
jgi:hypothetical protein